MADSLRSDDYIYPTVIDWAQIIADLVDAGCSRKRAARILGVPGSSFQRWGEGTEPRESIGRALLALHARYCGQHVTERRIDQAQPASE